MPPAIYQPVLAVDDNVASFTDPTTHAVQTDPSAGNVYIADVLDTPPPSPSPTPWNPYTINLLTSTNDGASFSQSANLGGGNISFAHDAAPQIAISQGTSNGTVKGGQVHVVYDDYGSDAAVGLDVLFSQSVTNNFTAGVLTSQTVGGAVEITTTSTRDSGGIPTGPASPIGAAAPLGFAPAPQIASDNTLGSFSPFEGRLYVVYTDRYDATRFPAFAGKNETDNTDIFMVWSDDGGRRDSGAARPVTARSRSTTTRAR